MSCLVLSWYHWKDCTTLEGEDGLHPGFGAPTGTEYHQPPSSNNHAVHRTSLRGRTLEDHQTSQRLQGSKHPLRRRPYQGRQRGTKGCVAESWTSKEGRSEGSVPGSPCFHQWTKSLTIDTPVQGFWFPKISEFKWSRIIGVLLLLYIPDRKLLPLF